MHSFRTPPVVRVPQGRGYRAGRCARCGLRLELCLCAELRPLRARTAVHFLMHWREQSKPSNTVRLARCLLTNSSVTLRGHPVSDGPTISQRVSGLPAGRCLLLFPSEHAIDLRSFSAVSEDEEPWQLLVPDGTWPQARRLLRKESALAQVPQVTVPLSLRRYALRRTTSPGLLSTLEAVAAALSILESDQIADQLLQKFELWQHRALASRSGGLPTEVVESP